MMTADDLIRWLSLEPLPEEGGYFRQTHKTKEMAPAHNGLRAWSTAIYYLVTPENFSALHVLPQDEMFHFYLGDSVEMVQIDSRGQLTSTIIGPDIAGGQSPQVLAAGNIWQGTRLLDGGKWALLGCTVSPGFEYADFVMKPRSELVRMFPQHAKVIEKYTREE